MNAEIALKNIKSNEAAHKWLQSTFLYGFARIQSHSSIVRIKRNPGHYRLKNANAENAKLSAEKRLEAIFDVDLNILETAQFVERDSHLSTITSTGLCFSSLSFLRIWRIGMQTLPPIPNC